MTLLPKPKFVPLETPFDRFWAAWPAHRRKRDKKTSLSRWNREKLDDKVDHVLAVLKIDKAKWAEANNKYVPAPEVWIQKRMWDCEIEDIAPKRSKETHPLAPKMVRTQDQKDQIEALARVKAASMAENLEMVHWAQRLTHRAHVGFTAAYLIRIQHDRENKHV